MKVYAALHKEEEEEKDRQVECKADAHTSLMRLRGQGRGLLGIAAQCCDNTVRDFQTGTSQAKYERHLGLSAWDNIKHMALLTHSEESNEEHCVTQGPFHKCTF